MADEPREHLEARFFDGVASAEDDQALAATAARSPDARRAAARQVVVDRILRRMAAPPLDPAPVMRAIERNEPAFVDRVMHSVPRPRGPRRSALAWTAAAGILAAAATVALWPRRGEQARDEQASHARAPQVERSPIAPPESVGPPAAAGAFARLERTSGTARAVGAGGRALVPPADLPAGAAIVTLGSASSALALRSDGTRIEVGGDAVFTALGGDAALLARGPVVVAAVGPLAVATPHTLVEVPRQGARFRVEVGPLVTRVDVDAGGARLRPSSGGVGVEVTAGRYALVQDGREPQLAEQARGGRLLFVMGELPPRRGDKALVARLDRLGYEVGTMLPGDATLEARALASRVVLISSTVASPDLTARLRQAPVPVVTWERSLFDDLGMTAPCEEDGCGETTQLTVLIKDPTHPLAAGLAGAVTPSDAGPFTWGTPRLDAAWVATASGHPERAVVFGYEAGAQMLGLVAPARRVALFMGGWSAGKMREAGWRLFEAAVEWAAASPR